MNVLAANRPSPTCQPPDEQMFNVARPQPESQPRQLTPLTDTVPDRCQPAAASLSPSTSSPPPIPHDGVPGSGDSPATAADDPATWSTAGAVPPAAHRRRAVDASDLRQCALVQTRLKAWKSGYVLFSLVK